jgi:outer membrane protein assembly factor BamD
MNKFFLLFILFAVLTSCTKKEEFKESVINEKSLDLQVLETYQEGMKNLESGDVLYAAKSLMK